MHFTKLNDRASRWFIASAILLNLGQWITVATWPAVELAPLHYTIYFGIDLTGPTWQLYAIPAVGAIIILIHGLLSLIKPSELWRRLWTLTAFVNCILLTSAMITLRVISFQ